MQRRVTGVVTQSMLAALLAQRLPAETRRQRVRDLHPLLGPFVYTVRGNCSAGEAFRRMLEKVE